MKHNSIIKLCLGLFMAFLMAWPTIAQEVRTYSGVVVDENNEPVIGAAVRVVGTTTGSITDLDGHFSVKLPSPKSEVEISYIGYITRKITDFSEIKIVLKEDTQQMEEVVVVGYGTQKKAHLTGSIATVPMDDIQDLSGGSLASLLSGLVPGLSVSGGNARPGENATITIRDAGSLDDVGSSTQEPLFVIDGYVYPNSVQVANGTENLGSTAFNNLDPTMIESISVLKDAAAAVYGARAANGVILVTTKKGKLGAPQVSYSGSVGFTDEVSRAKMLSAYDYGRLWNIVAAGNPDNTSLNSKTDLFQADELEAMKNLNYDLLDKYWKTALTQKHSVNVSGATEKANYFGGISYFLQDGNLGRLDYSRWNYRAGVDLKVSKWLKVSLMVSGDYGKKNKPNVKVGGTNQEKDYNLLLTRPYYIPEEVNGYPIAAYGVSNESLSTEQQYSFSVLQDSGDYSKTVDSNLSINGSIEYDFGWCEFLRGLNVRFSYAKSINTDKGNEYGSEYTIYYLQNRAGSGSHLYTPVSGTDYDSIINESNFGSTTVSNGDYLSRTTNRTDNYQMNLTVSYARDFGRHHVSGLFSIERSEAESEYLYGYVSEPYEFTTGQSNSAEGTTNYTTFKRGESGSLSYIGRLNYSYDDKYLFEFLMRSDASTKFAPENYWGYFPSVSAGWIISQESWFQKHVNWVDYLKIRASFGLTGRDNTDPWQWMQVYAQDANDGTVFGTGSSNGSGNRITINKTNSAVNRDVHWDKSYKANLGLDFNVLNNRLSFTIDGYYEWNREMLMSLSQSVPGTVGTQSADLNIGKMDSYGVEVAANWRDRIGKDFKYKIGVNTGYGDNKVLAMDFEDNYSYRKITKGSSTDVGDWGMQCIGMFRSYQDIEEYFDKYGITSYMGMSKDKVRPGMLIYKDVRGAKQTDGSYAGPDGIVDADNDQVRMSRRKSNPYHFTTNLSAEWKGLSLTAQLSASWGGYSSIPTDAIKTGGNLEYTNMPSFWNPDNMFVYENIYDASGNLLAAENRDGTLPNLYYAGESTDSTIKNINSEASTFWRVSGTRITLNRVTLAYTIPSKYTKPIGINSCRFNITGQNLLSFYNPYPDNFIDPMTSYGSYPTLRKFTIGVNVTF